MKKLAMKRLTVAVLALSVLFLAAPLLAADSETLQGEFIWERDDQDIAGPLKAVFEPTGDATWDVAFYFTFEDENHVYKGTAEGSLTEGELVGKVISDGEEPHPYSFTGSFAEDGSFSGTHSYLGGDEARPTGKITLSR